MGVRGARRGGVRVLLKIPGGGSPGGRGAEGPGGCLRRIGDLGGGLNIFLGAEMSTKVKRAVVSLIGGGGLFPIRGHRFSLREIPFPLRASLKLFSCRSRAWAH